MMRLFRRYTKIPLRHEYENKPIRIVGDAAIASATVGDGRLIPLLIIDTEQRPDLEELIRIHEHLPPGDVGVQWGILSGAPDRVALILTFKKPVEAAAVVEFSIIQQGILVDQILATKVFYLQSGRPGDRFINTPTAKRIYVEVADTGFPEHWDKLFHKHVAKEMRTRGLGRQEAKRAATQAIGDMRALSKFRMKPE